MKRLVLVTSFVTVLISMFGCQAPGPKHSNALKAYKKGDYERAISLWSVSLSRIQADRIAHRTDTELRYKVAFDIALAYVDWWKACQAKDPDVALDKLHEALDYLREAEKVGTTDFSIRQEMLNRVSELRESIVDAYRKEAEQGRADAQYSLGVCYANGEGVTKDEAEAVMWFRKAAEQGNVKALEVLREQREGSLHRVASLSSQFNDATKEIHSKYYMDWPLGTVRGLGTVISSPGNFFWAIGKTFTMIKGTEIKGTDEKKPVLLILPFSVTLFGTFFCTADIILGSCDVGTLGWFGNEYYTEETGNMLKKPWFWERPLTDDL